MNNYFCPVCQGTKRAIGYIEANVGDGLFPSYGSSTPNGADKEEVYPEIFSSIAIASILPNSQPFRALRRKIISRIKETARGGLMSFFDDEGLIAPDADTNSLGYALLLEDGAVSCRSADRILDSILEYCDSAGRVQVWISHERENYTDPVVSANVLYYARLLGRDRELVSTMRWLLDSLDADNPHLYSRYYHSPYALLFFISRLLGVLDLPLLRKGLWGLWRRVACATDVPKSPLDLSMLILAAEVLGIDSMHEKFALIAMQEKDGSWPADALYREGKRALYYCNTSVPTSFAVTALHGTCGHTDVCGRSQKRH